MSGYFQLRAYGHKELADGLRTMPVDLATGALKLATSAGASVIRNRADVNVRGAVRSRTGTLFRALYQKNLRNESTFYRAVAIIAFRSGRKFQRVKTKGGKTISLDAWYWRLLELGFTLRSGRHYQGRRFLTNAFEETKEEAARAVADRLAKRITRYAKQIERRVNAAGGKARR